jgi:hypothetical protein
MGSDKLVLFSFQNEAASPAATMEVLGTSPSSSMPVTSMPESSMEMEAPRPVERRVNSRANPEFLTDKTANSKNGVSKMDVMKMLAELRQEREHIEEAILTLERLARGRGKRRGRPPAWMKEVKKRGRPPGSKNKAKDTSPN